MNTLTVLWLVSSQLSSLGVLWMGYRLGVPFPGTRRLRRRLIRTELRLPSVWVPPVPRGSK